MNKTQLVDAYIDFMGHIYEAMDDTLHSFADALTIAQHKLKTDKNLTSEQLMHLSAAMQRDIHHAAKHLNVANSDAALSEWLKFDIQLLENFTLDAFLSVADKTRIELAQLNELAHVHRYHSGDVTIPGTFICDNCGKQIAFKTPSQIPSCPVCHADNFVRM